MTEKTITINLVTDDSSPDYLEAQFSNEGAIELHDGDTLSIQLGDGWASVPDASLVYVELFGADTDTSPHRADKSKRFGGWSANMEGSGGKWRDVWQRSSAPLGVDLSGLPNTIRLRDLYPGDEETDFFFEVGVYSARGFEISRDGERAATVYLWTPDPEVKLTKGTGTP